MRISKIVSGAHFSVLVQWFMCLSSIFSQITVARIYIRISKIVSGAHFIVLVQWFMCLTSIFSQITVGFG